VIYRLQGTLVPPASRILPRRAARSALLIALFVACGAKLLAAPLSLRHGKNGVPIVTGAAPSAVEQFAASELARYLGRMTGATFAVETPSHIGPEALVVGRAPSLSLDPSIAKEDLGEDGFVIRKVGGRVLIAGASDRGTLYAVYALLEKLGCRWFAPNFSFYGSATGELVPHIANPAVNDWNVVEKPAFKWRKLYIEEGWSHTEENLKQMVDWMAKARMNVLDCPIDYQHLHRTEWDHWRTAITPELRKRGMLIEVGGHGYPNFLSTEKYFAQHPEWFGVYDGKRSTDPREVFATSNPDAVNTFVANVRSYLKSHPEIDILDVWPPDGARWSDAPEDLALGSPSERQTLLLNHLYQELKTEFPKLRLQFIAYQVYTVPPSEHKPDPGVLMEFCPINRSFESPLYASDYPQSEEYFHDLESWLKGVMDPSNIAIYSYITKYAWRSYPVLIPHLIVDEARRFHSLGIGGMSTYSEPGNWATFELDHYITARALWNPQLNTDAELADYTSHRYGPAGPAVLGYLSLVEQVVPHAIGIPGTELTVEKQRMMLRYFAPAAGLLKQAHAEAGSDSSLQLLLAKLDSGNEYVQNEMEISLAILMSAQGSGNNRLKNIQNLLAERERIVSSHHEDGVILPDNRTP
jgi:hypothetical protein